MDARPSPEQARRDFVAWFGGMEAIGAALRERMGPLGAQILGRELDDDELRRRANEVHLVTLAKWPKAPEETSPEAHLVQMVELWADELRQQVRLNCWDVLFVPLFAVLLPGSLLSVVLPDWAALAGGIVLAVPLMRWWIRERRTGRVALGDD